MSTERVVLPAVMPHTVQELRAQLAQVLSYAPAVHLDIMDGLLVPSTSWPYSAGGLPAVVGTPQFSQTEAHLMVRSPRELGELLVHAGIPSIIAQLEGFDDADDAARAITAWRAAGAAHVGISLMADTPLAAVAPVVNEIDRLQIMTIARTGFQGEPFDARGLSRVHDTCAAHPGAVVCADGAISQENIAQLSLAGATRFAVGSAIIRATDPAAAYREIVAALQTAATTDCS
jgi:ribulose-phosphate 3-epimerase